MAQSFDDIAAKMSAAAHVCQKCGVMRRDHATAEHEFKSCDPLSVFDEFNRSARARESVNHMGASYECLTCGGDVRGCMC